jgi:hypothetical protein
MNVRNRKISLFGAALSLMIFAGAAYAVQADLTLGTDASGCIDSPPVFQEINALCNVVSPVGGQVTCRLRNVSLGVLAAGPTVGQVVSYNLRRNTSPSMFPPAGSTSGYVYRVCANNNVAGRTARVQLLINGF